MTKITKKIVLFLLLSISIHTFSQNERRFIESKNSISLNLFGTSAMVGVSYERLFFNQVAAEVGVGLYGFGVGVTYYPICVQKNKINPYIGVKYNQIFLLIRETIYAPIGITYASKWNLNFGTDIGFAYYPDKKYQSNAPLFMLKEGSQIGYLWNLKIGYRF